MTTSRADRAFKIAALSPPSPTIKLAIAPQGVGVLLRERLGFPKLRSFDLPTRLFGVDQSTLGKNSLSRAASSRTLEQPLVQRIRDVEDALLEHDGLSQVALAKGREPVFVHDTVYRPDSPSQIQLPDYNPLNLAHEGRHGVQWHAPTDTPLRLGLRDIDHPSLSQVQRHLTQLGTEADANRFALQFAQSPDEIAQIAAGQGSYAQGNLRSLPYTAMEAGETAISELLQGRDPRRGVALETLEERAVRPLIDPTYWKGRINGSVRRAQLLPAHEAISQSILEQLGSGPATAYDDVVREALRKVAPQFKW